MSLTRRVALLEWARRTGAWILEDDHSSEYRYASYGSATLPIISTTTGVGVMRTSSPYSALMTSRPAIRMPSCKPSAATKVHSAR